MMYHLRKNTCNPPRIFLFQIGNNSQMEATPYQSKKIDIQKKVKAGLIGTTSGEERHTCGLLILVRLRFVINCRP